MTEPKELLLGTSYSSRIVFAEEGLATGGSVGLKRVEVEMTHREWDVTDMDARNAAAREELGEDFDWYRTHPCAQWFINPDNNSAALCVYRTKENGAGVRERSDEEREKLHV